MIGLLATLSAHAWKLCVTIGYATVILIDQL